MSLDRIDCNGQYCPENCRWATKLEQTQNRRNVKWVTHDGVTDTVKGWANRLGMSEATIHRKVKVRGMSIAEVLSNS